MADRGVKARCGRRRSWTGIVLLALFLLSCSRVGQTLRIAVIDPVLSIEARLEFPPKKMPDGKFRLRGHLVVINRSSRPAAYGNAFLWLEDDKGESSRAFYDAPASVIYDRATADIAPMDSLVQPVYWMRDVIAPGSAWRLRLDRAGLEAAAGS